MSNENIISQDCDLDEHLKSSAGTLANFPGNVNLSDEEIQKRTVKDFKKIQHLYDIVYEQIKNNEKSNISSQLLTMVTAHMQGKKDDSEKYNVVSQFIESTEGVTAEAEPKV